MNELKKVLWYYGIVDNVNVSETKIICPFHKDQNPSMIIDFEKGNYFCFGCQKSGDALKFVQEVEKRNKLNDLQACHKYVRILKSKKVNRLNIVKVEKTKEQQPQLYKEAYDYFHGLSKVNWYDVDTENLEYLEYMIKRGFTQKVLNYAKAKLTYNRSYPIIFPMLDNGKFKGWVCRTTDKEVEKRRKYLYNKGFRRKNSLIGNYGNNEVLFVVEGFMDMLKFWQFGKYNVVAILGWKMSQIQIDKIKKCDKIKYIVSALDNDDCGKKGSEYLKSVFPDKYTRFCFLKKYKDVGESNEKDFEKMYKKTLAQIDT